LPKPEKIDFLSKTLVSQIDEEIFKRKAAPIAAVLKIAGAGLFLAASIVVPTLPVALKPFLTNENEYKVWKRFNIPYLKRALNRLEKQKLVEISEEEGMQVVKITDQGRKRILRYALEEVEIKKPGFWDGTWWLVSYDLPEHLGQIRDLFRDYLKAWGFYPLQESVFLHAYPCEKEVDFLREYFGIAEKVRIFRVSKIENDKIFKDFFGVE
jgi:DNA-binding PadR family transcriptional regulator